MTFQHRAGVRPYTSSCDLAESCVFDKQSLGPFRCDPHALGELGPVTSRGHSFSRSYGVSVPSSLTIVLPIASVFSTRPPVSVLVRAPGVLPRGFYMEHGLAGFAHSLRRHASPLMRRGFTCAAGYALSRGRPEPRPAILLRRPVGTNVPQTVQECPPVVHRLRLSASP